MKTKSKSKLKAFVKRGISAVMIGILSFSMITVTNMYYGYSPYTAYAAELSGIPASVAVPAWNAGNIPARDTSGTVKYYYAGNAFTALNQLDGGAKQSGGTSGHLQIYSDSGGARLVETTYNGKKAVKGNYSGGSDFNTYSQRTDLDFNKIWELMDTDAVWDNQYLFAQYKTNAFAAVTSAFSPTILQTVDGWYGNGFSYDGSAASRPSISAPGKSWFSEAEKKAVKAASVKTDGNEGSSNTTSTDVLNNAHLFAPSIDEMYYNPVQVEKLIENLAADKSDVYNATGWQYARSHLWSRSFWGVHSFGDRLGFSVYSTGQVGVNHVAYEFAVAPAFYLDLEQVKMARSAKAGTNVTANAALAAYNPGSISGDVKFLVQDSSFAPNFTSSINGKTTGNVVAGNTYSVDYRGAVTTPVNAIGANNDGKLVISAAIYDSQGKVLYYGPVANASTEGTVNIKIPSGLSKETTYTLALFEEQLGGSSTWKTKDNNKNGATFTQTNGGTYTAYETDYMSGSVAYMTFNVAYSDFNVQVNENAYLYSGRTYSGKEIAEAVTATIGGNALSSSEYFVMKKSDFEALGTTVYSTLSTAATVNRVEIAPILSNENSSVDLTFIYYDPNKKTTAQVVERTITVVADQIENSVDFDSATWYQSEENGIVWNYKLNSAGDIIGLYTDDSIVRIVDGGKTLNIPAKVAGRTVIGIGSGSEEHPFIPASERSWTSISFPSSVAIIQDYAFCGNSAMANVAIPSTITNIGVKAFYASSIESLKVNGMSGTIGSLAFGDAHAITNVTLKGGRDGLVISSIAFRESNATSVTINGNVTLNKNAFKNNRRLGKVYISGTVVLNEYAFSGCTAVDSLELDGNISVGAYAFNSLTSLEHLYIPAGVRVAQYAFNNCSNLSKLEVNTNLVNNAFENCGAIQTLILDENVTSVAFDWEGHTGNYNNRKVYVKNKNTMFEMYGNNGSYISSFGSSGDVVVYILNDQTVDQGRTVAPNGNILSLLGYTCYAHSMDYTSYITGLARSVTFYSVNSIDAQLASDHIDASNNAGNEPQTGIDAYYNGVILTTRDIVKDNMTVIPIFGSNEGSKTYASDEFYIIRTTEFNELEKTQAVTVANVSSYEPVHAMDSDLDIGQDTGTISVTVVVFYDNNGSEAYFSVPVSVRVEEYTDKSFVEQEYGSYENIVKELASLSQKVDQLKGEIATLQADKEADTARINELSVELTAYKRAYETLLEKFSEFVASSHTDDSGYFGTYKDPETGTVKDVVFIEGNPTEYEDTGNKTADNKTIYIGQYDTNGDGNPETIKFYVDAQGVHVVDDTGASTGDVYEDKLGAIERQTAAKLKELEKALGTSQAGLSAIIAALREAGYEFDLDVTIDEQYKEIVRDIQAMAGRIENLETQLNAADQLALQYENALASIYALLTNSTLTQDNVSGINNTLVAITSKISALQNNLNVAKATVKDLESRLTTAESERSALEAELATTKSQLQKANTDLANAQQQKNDLIAQYEKALADGDVAAAERLQAQIAEKENAIAQLTALQGTLAQKEQDIKDAQNTVGQLRSQLDAKNQEIASLQAQLDSLTGTADGFKVTVETANKMFGLTLPDGSTDREIASAIQNYVRDKISSDETIAAIQKLLGTNKTGVELVAAVESAVSNANSGGNPEDGSKVDPNSASYKQGYQSGYDAGVTAGSAGKTSDTVVNMQSESYKQGYSVGYNQGYAKAAADLSGNAGNTGTGENDSALKSQVTSLTTQVSTLTSKNSEQQKKIDALEDDISDLKDENRSLKDKNNSLSSQVGTLNSDISGLKTTNTNLSTQVKDLSGKNDTLDNQVSTLTTKNASLSSEVSSLRTQVSTAGRSTGTTTAASAATSTKSGTGTTTAAAESSDKSVAASDKKSETDDGDLIEGSTGGLDSKPETTSAIPDVLVGDSTVAAENSQKRLGTTSEVSMFSDAEINTIPGAQYAKGSVIRFTESKPIVKFSDTNGKEINDITGESLENIYKVFSYYANHLEELGRLGSDDVANAASDESKAVILDMVAAGDIKANVTQETAFRNSRSAVLNVRFPNITTGALYLVVHERADQAGQYEVCLTTAVDNSLSLNVSSLSPVAVAKVEVKDAGEVVSLTGENAIPLSGMETPDQPEGSGLRVVSIVLIVVMLLLATGFVVLIKMKRDGKLPSCFYR